MDLHNSTRDLHNSIMDVHNSIVDLRNSIMDLHNYGLFMDLHNCFFMDLHNWYLWISIIIYGSPRFKIQR